MVLQRFMEAIPVRLAVSLNPQQHLADHHRRCFYTAHGEVAPAYSLSDLAALAHLIHLFDLSCGVDHH
jgi:hypothetical protein